MKIVNILIESVLMTFDGLMTLDVVKSLSKEKTRGNTTQRTHGKQSVSSRDVHSKKADVAIKNIKERKENALGGQKLSLS